MTKEEFTIKVLDNMPKPPSYFFHDAKLVLFIYLFYFRIKLDHQMLFHY